ncbi:MAG: 16S rRNA (cytidine(1402)-2'-O)-methyltransferase [Pseudomonadota bacterium]
MTATVSNDASELSIDRPALYVVATPIGNLADISARAIDVLSNVDLVCVEDTRVSAKLFSAYGIRTKMQVLHDHNERATAAALIKRMQENRLAVAQISDAGTPLISDPGYGLVNAAIEADVPVRPVPGPSAVMSALMVSGLPVNQFVFVGFLSAKLAAKTRELEMLKLETRTMVLFEAPHRIQQTLGVMLEVFGPARRGVLARELTKRFETLYRGTLAELATTVSIDSNLQKGELVVVIEGASADNESAEVEARRILSAMMAELPLSQAVKITQKITGAKKNALYEWATRDSQSDDSA